jgi:hypothetical protein
MSIELDGITLIRHVRDPDTGVTTLVHSVHNINVSEKRSIVEHRIPGLQGGVLQDLGREPVRISFEGLIFGKDALQFVEWIRSKYRAGAPVPFSSGLSRVAEVTQVLIEELQVEEVGGVINTYTYWMVLKEYTLPPEEEEPAPSQDEAAAEAVQQQAEDDQESINYILGKVIDADGNPQSDVDVKITFDGGEYTVKTDGEGVYRKDDLNPGKYTITVDASGYEDVKEEVEIQSQKASK